MAGLGWPHPHNIAIEGPQNRIMQRAAKADIGVIGLAVMGQNLVLNMNDHGFTVAVYNRTVARVDEFVAGAARGTRVIGTHSIRELVSQLKLPRRVMLMVKAGGVVDQNIETLLRHLQPGDIIIDGGNSNYRETVRRTQEVESRGLHYIGTGVSGGEEGARYGPSIMPGGSQTAWTHVRPIFQSIAAKVNGSEPCCDWVGPGGAGHFVKMVHNGIEYGDMQIISEAYLLMKELLGFSNEEQSRIFDEWNQGKLDSYLIEITRDILAYKDKCGLATIDSILDSAGQKGTGKWTVAAALDTGVPLTLIGEAVLARFLSARVAERRAAFRVLAAPDSIFDGDRRAFVQDLQQAVYAAKIMSYAQGYLLMRTAASMYDWDLNYGNIALLWRGGCIIRSAFLDKIKDAFEANPKLENLLLAPYFATEIAGAQSAWRRVVAAAAIYGLPVPALGSALSFYDGYRRERGSANLIQAQRDYFGAHTYERTDQERGKFYHTNWTGAGGSVTAGSYDA